MGALEHIGSIMKRAVPGLFRDPATVIGTCKHCDDPVTHAAGDLDAEGRARHDACDSRARSTVPAEFRCMNLFFQTASTMSRLPGLKDQVEKLIRDMPDRFSASHALGFTTRCEALVRAEPVSDQRREVLEALRLIRRSFFTPL